MIHSFQCSNFYSFDEPMGIDFEVDKRTPKNDSYAKTKSDLRLSLVEAVIGPNASGKTNLLKALPMMKWLIADSFDSPPFQDLPVKSFMPHLNSKIPTKLSVVFDVEGKEVYEYEVHLTPKRINFESLRVKSLSSKRVTQKVLLSRNYNTAKDSYEVNFKNFNAPPGFAGILRHNATALSTAVRLNHGLSKQIVTYWQSIEFNVIEQGWIGDQVFGPQASVLGALQLYHQNRELKERAEAMLSKFDLGFVSFEFDEKSSNQIDFKIAHSFGDKQLSLPIDYESSGTKQLFIILKIILSALAQGGVAIIDEFDSRLHPDMIEELIDLFTDKSTNPKSAQILFSTHNHLILSKLDKYQIVLTEKNEKGYTEAWRLDEMEGVRADDNYFAKYMAGAYGAVPTFD